MGSLSKKAVAKCDEMTDEHTDYKEGICMCQPSYPSGTKSDRSKMTAYQR